MGSDDRVVLADADVLAMLGGVRIGEVRTAELDALVGIAQDRGAGTVAIGHGREHASVDAARRFATAWTRTGGSVGEVVSWPEDAASWLRPARRLCAGDPDLWLLTGHPLGVSQLLRRLLVSTSWRPGATLLTSQATHPWLRWACPPGSLAGLTGIHPDGSSWRVAASIMDA